MLQISDLLSAADTYMALTGAKEVTLSYWIFEDSAKLTALRGGAGITVQRFNNAMCWLAAHWPEDSDRPVKLAAYLLPPVSGAASAELPKAG